MAADIELILMRQLAGYLAMPIFVVDPDGDLLFYNEPAEALLGRRFDEAGPMPMAEWSTSFTQRDEAGSPLPPDTQPLVIAVRERRPSHRAFWITGHDGVARRLGVTAVPLEGREGRHFGAVAFFWAAEQEEAGRVDSPPGGPPAAPGVQREIELILIRRLARYLGMPMLIVDRGGDLLYVNPPAEVITGRGFEQAGQLSLEEWTALLPLYGADGTPVPREARPVMRALRERRPTHTALRIVGLDGRARRIESTVLPLEGQGGRLIGAVAIFWETGGADAGVEGR